MKKYLLLAAGFLALAVPAMADTTVVTTTNSGYTTQTNAYYNANEITDRTGRNQFGLDIAGAVNNDDLSDALYLGADWNYGINQWFALGVEAGWEGPDFDFGDNSLDVVTVFGDAIFRLNVPEWQAVPYAVVGMGVLNASSDVSNFDSSDTSFAMKFGGGFDWFVTRNWILNFEVAYIATGGDLPAANGVSQSLDHWRIGGGLKYAF